MMENSAMWSNPAMWSSKTREPKFVSIASDSITNLSCVTQFVQEGRSVKAFLSNGYTASYKFKNEEMAKAVFQCLKEQIGVVDIETEENEE